MLTYTLMAAFVLVGVMWLGQRQLIYRPDRERVPPAAEGLSGVAEIELQAPDGARLVAWYLAPSGKAPSVLYFHGNGAGLADRAARVRILQAAGYGLLMPAYRGYAGSTGKPSEHAIMADARLAYDWLRAQGVAAKQLVLFGESLGSGVAVQIAAQVPVAGVILDSPFTSLMDVAAGHFRLVPMRLILADRYDSMAHIGQINAPLLIVHGEADRVVPFTLGKRLFEAAREPKQHRAFPGVGHLVPFDGQGWPPIRDFLKRIADGSAAG